MIDYLNANPKVLENYIMDSVSREQLEKWLIRKIHAQESNENGSKRLLKFHDMKSVI